MSTRRRLQLTAIVAHRSIVSPIRHSVEIAAVAEALIDNLIERGLDPKELCGKVGDDGVR